MVVLAGCQTQPGTAPITALQAAGSEAVLPAPAHERPEHLADSVDARPVAQRLRVLTFNIHHGEGASGIVDLAAIADLINMVSPDLVSLQEVELGTERSGGVDQTAALSAATGLASAFGWNVDFRGGGFGNAVLSRHPIVSVRNQGLPYPASFEPRGLLQVSIELPDGEVVTLLATHLDHLDPGVRLRSVKAINDLVGGLGQRPVILAGDLNAEPGSPTLSALADRWTTGTSAVPTYPAVDSFKRIDHVLATPSDRWRVTSTIALGDASLSDHRALLVILDLLD